MKFSEFADYLHNLESTTLRLKLTEILADLFNRLAPEEISEAIYMLQGRIAPLYVNREFGLSEKLIARACLLATGVDAADFARKVQQLGDIGLALEAIKKELHEEYASLSISEIFAGLSEIASYSGGGSVEKKLAHLSRLIKTETPRSSKYLIRVPAGVLRLGISDATIMDGLSWMLSGTKGFRPVIEKAYQVRPDLGFLAHEIKSKGIESLSGIAPVVFTPILMMRAERASSAEEILSKSPIVLVEDKYDGFRLQVHVSLKEKKVALYSRGLEDMSEVFPDITKAVLESLPQSYDQLIFEGEAVGVNPKTGELLPFQETVQRKRKHDIANKAKEIPLKLFIFDVLYANGTALLYKPLSERRAFLEQMFHALQDPVLILSPSVQASTKERIQEVFNEAAKRKREGIMAKKPDGPYTPGARNFGWMKLKISYDTKLNDTIDAVVMGYDAGRGKRTGFGIGAFLVGVYDENDSTFKTIAKIGTGLTDEEWRHIYTLCKQYETPVIPPEYRIDKQMACDAYVLPAIVVEIRADEITFSPLHTAGRKSVDNGLGGEEMVSEGYALRFPRLERFRSDKKPYDVTTVAEIIAMALKQRG